MQNLLFQEVQKWKTDSYTTRSELKALETANNGLKAQLQAANDRIEHLNKTINDQTIKIRECKSYLFQLIRKMKSFYSDFTSSPS